MVIGHPPPRQAAVVTIPRSPHGATSNYCPGRSGRNRTRVTMSFRFRAKESPAVAVRRIARSELRLAAAALRRHSRETVRIHTARKHLKKLRAVLRLVRAQTGTAFFRTHNRRLRDLGRRLAPLRDAQVALLTLARLRRRAPDTRTRRAASHLRRLINARLPHETREAVLRSVADELQALRREVGRWPLNEIAWPDLARALTRTYRRAQIEREHFRLRRDVASLHEWRKRSKDLWYQLLLLDTLCRKPARKLACALDELTDTQGLMHDLQLVLDSLHRHVRTLAVWERQAISELTGDRLEELDATALRLGNRVFLESPSSFLQNLRAHPK